MRHFLHRNRMTAAIPAVENAAAVVDGGKKRDAKSGRALWRGWLCGVLCAAVAAVGLLSAPAWAAAAEQEDGPFRPSSVIVSMGDSFSSGEGNEPFYGQKKKFLFWTVDRELEEKLSDADWLAHRSTKSWPGRLSLPGIPGQMKDYWKQNTHWYFVATSGAETWHMYVPFDKKIDKVSYNPSVLKSTIKSLALTLAPQLGVPIECMDFLYGGDLQHIKYVDSDTIKPQLDILKELKRGGVHVDYVTLTLGGNDLGFTDIVSKVVLSDLKADEQWNKDIDSGKKTGEKKTTLQNMLDTAEDYVKHMFTTNLRDVYKDIAENVDEDTVIIVAGYPHLFSEYAGDISCGLLIIDNIRPASALGTAVTDIVLGGKQFYRYLGGVVSEFEAKQLNSSIDKCNSTIKSIIENLRKEQKINIYFVDIVEAFEADGLDHGAYSADPYLNPVMIVRTIQDLEGTLSGVGSAYSIHPNAKGIAAYAKAVQKVIDQVEVRKRFEYAWKQLEKTASWYENCRDSVRYSILGNTYVEQTDTYDGKIEWENSDRQTVAAKAFGNRRDGAADNEWQSYAYDSKDSGKNRPEFFADKKLGDRLEGLLDNVLYSGEFSFGVLLSKEQYLRLKLDVNSVAAKWRSNGQAKGKSRLFDIVGYAQEKDYNGINDYYGSYFLTDDFWRDTMDYALNGNESTDSSGKSFIPVDTENVIMLVNFYPDMTFRSIQFETSGHAKTEANVALDMDRSLFYAFSDKPTSEYINYLENEQDAYSDFSDYIFHLSMQDMGF